MLTAFPMSFSSFYRLGEYSTQELNEDLLSMMQPSASVPSASVSHSFVLTFVNGCVDHEVATNINQIGCQIIRLRIKKYIVTTDGCFSGRSISN